MKQGNPRRPFADTLVYGRRSLIVKKAFRFYVLGMALRAYRDPALALKVLRALISLKQSLEGSLDNLKWLKSGSRYFWNISSPGWPSRAFESFLLHEMNRLVPLPISPNRYQTLIFSITSRCPLNCEHCYEYSNLDSRELLSLSELQQILNRFQKLGVSNLELSGGEPLSRFDDLLALLQAAKAGTDFWILSSGFGLELRKAWALKKAGLTGVAISLDHHIEAEHNRFRGNPQSFQWVWKAVKNAQSVGLAVALSLCIRREFLSEENLDSYLQLALEKGVKLVRILEPREVGRFKGQNVELNEAELDTLDNWFLKVSNDPAYRNYPILDYLAYYQRRRGCFGGDRYLYIDSRGALHACPFCQEPAGSALDKDLEPALSRLQKLGCLKYPKFGSEKPKIAN